MMNEFEQILAEYLIKEKFYFDFDYIDDTNHSDIYEVIKDEEVVGIYSVVKENVILDTSEIEENWLEIFNGIDVIKEEYFNLDKVKEHFGKAYEDNMFSLRTKDITSVKSLFELLDIKTDNATLKKYLKPGLVEYKEVAKDFYDEIEIDDKSVNYKGYIITELEV